MNNEQYVVYNQDKKKVGYLQRQGQDTRLMDTERNKRLQSFFPWDKAVVWIKKNNYTLKQVDDKKKVIMK